MAPAYDVSTINGKMLGFGEPIRVKQGQRLLLHILNSSATDVHWIAFAGHTFRVIALDGNPVASPQSVAMLSLAPAERVSALVELNNPGVWILGEVRKHIQFAGMGIVVEYAGFNNKPVWNQPEELVWNYSQFAAPINASPPKPTASTSSSTPNSTATAPKSSGASTASPIPTPTSPSSPPASAIASS